MLWHLRLKTSRLGDASQAPNRAITHEGAKACLGEMFGPKPAVRQQTVLPRRNCYRLW